MANTEQVSGVCGLSWALAHCDQGNNGWDSYQKLNMSFDWRSQETRA